MAYSVTIDTDLNVARISRQVDSAVGQFSRFEQRVRSASANVNANMRGVDFNTMLDGLSGVVINSQNTASVLDLLQDSVGGLAGRFTGLGGAVGLAGAFFVTMAKMGTDYADSLNDMSDRTGIAAEDLAGLELVAKLADTSLESLAEIVNKLSVNLANNGAELAQFGVTAKDPLEALMQLADVLSTMDDVQQRAALATKFLGRGWAELAPLLSQGSAAIRQQITQGKEWSQITGDNVKKAGEFNDKVDELTFRIKGLNNWWAGHVLQNMDAIGNRFDILTAKTDTWYQTINKALTALLVIKETAQYLEENGFATNNYQRIVSPEIASINDEIIQQKKLVDVLQQEGLANKNSMRVQAPTPTSVANVIGGLIDNAVYDFNEEQDKLNQLLKKREQLLQQQVTALNSAKPPPVVDNKTQSPDQLYRAAAQKYQVPYELVVSVAKIESSHNQQSVSPDGALGLMQVVPKSHPQADAHRLRSDAAYNVDYGVSYLAELLQRFNNNLPIAIAAYNAGPTAVQKSLDKTGQIPNYPETTSYVKNVLAEMDKLKGGTSALTDSLKQLDDQAKNERAAKVTRVESQIKTLQDTGINASNAKIDELKLLKEQGKIGIEDYFAALTAYQTRIVDINIEAINAKMRESSRQYEINKLITPAEEQSALKANYQAQQIGYQVERDKLMTERVKIEPVNLLSAEKEQKQIDEIVKTVQFKLAELNGKIDKDPLVIKAKIEFDNAQMLEKLRATGHGQLADQFVSSLTAREQSSVYETQINRISEQTQRRETQINIQQQSHAIGEYQAQQQLMQLYQDSADEIDKLAEKLQALGDNNGLDELKVKALEAKNAAGQLRLTLPNLNQKFINAGQTAFVDSMTTGLVNMANGAETAGQSFANMGLSIVQAMQQIAAQELAKQIFSGIIQLAGFAIGAGSGGGGTADGINLSNSSIGNSLSSFIPARQDGGIIPAFADGGLIKGPGTGTSDDILTLLPTGGFVLKAKAVQQIGVDNLHSLMSNQAPTVRPVRVSNGEYFIPPEFVQKHGRTFAENLNRGVQPSVIQATRQIDNYFNLTNQQTTLNERYQHSQIIEQENMILQNNAEKIQTFVEQTLQRKNETLKNQARVDEFAKFRKPARIEPTIRLPNLAGMESIVRRPPESLQRAYQGMGRNPVLSKNPAVDNASSQDITVNVPVTINQDSAQNKAAPDSSADAKMNELGQRIKAMVRDELVQQTRPGGMLWGMGNKR